MVINKKLYLLLLLLIIITPVFSQESNYYIDTESEFFRIVQRLSWSGGENSLRFEVMIHVLQDDDYEPFLVLPAEENFIEVSLPPGEYRFQVIAFDALNRPGEESDWAYIEVLPYMEIAFVPEIEPETGTEPEAEIEIETEIEPEIEYVDLPEKNPPVPIIRNTQIRIGTFCISPFSLYGEIDKEPFLPFGMEAHISIIPYAEIMNLHISTELTINWVSFEELNKVNNFGVNLLLLRWINDGINAFSFQVGVIFPVENDINNLAVNLGLIYHLRIFEPFMLEAGIDYKNYFDTPSSNTGTARFKLGFSFIF